MSRAGEKLNRIPWRPGIAQQLNSDPELAGGAFNFRWFESGSCFARELPPRYGDVSKRMEPTLIAE